MCCPAPASGTVRRSDCLASPRRLQGLPLYAAVGLLGSTGQALPWCPVTLSAHAAPATPEGPPLAWQLWWLWGHRPSPNVHRVGTLNLVSRLRLGSLRATACAVARPAGRSSGNLVLWVTPHTSLKLPGRLCQLPGPDFHRRVSQYPRHADVARYSTFQEGPGQEVQLAAWRCPSRSMS